MIELLIYMITMAITPGPNTILSMANASEKGFLKGIRLNFGMLAGITVIALLSYMLLSFLTGILPSLMTVLRILAVTYLMFLAVHMLKKPGQKDVSGSGGFLTGMMMQFLNVKVMLLCVSAESAYIIPMGKGRPEEILMVLMIPVCCFLCGLAWALGGHIISAFYGKHERLMKVIFSASLFLLAASGICSIINSFGN
ncbi:MAG: LysE family translocator [Bullifex sp.]